MITDDEKPIGAPVLRQTTRDRIAVWIAEHPWAVPAIRITGGLGLAAIAVFCFGVHYPLTKLVFFVIGAAGGGGAGKHERERGDTILDTLLADSHLAEPAESLPSEFDEFVPRTPDPMEDPRYRFR
jgi:hypothetical protein